MLRLFDVIVSYLFFILNVACLVARDEIHMDALHLSGVLNEEHAFRDVIRLAISEVQPDGDANLKTKIPAKQG